MTFYSFLRKRAEGEVVKRRQLLSEIRTCNVRNSCWVVNLARSLLCSRLGQGRPSAQQAGWGSRVIRGRELSWPAWLHPRAAVPGSHRTEALLSCAGTSSFPPLAPLTRWGAPRGTSPGAVTGSSLASVLTQAPCCCPGHSDVQLGLVGLTNKNRGGLVKFKSQANNRSFLRIGMTNALRGVYLH